MKTQLILTLTDLKSNCLILILMLTINPKSREVKTFTSIITLESIGFNWVILNEFLKSKLFYISLFKKYR